jgi:hypothetical protein
MSIKDAFEVFIKIFHDPGTQFVEDAAHLHPIIGVRIASVHISHQQTFIALTKGVQLRCVVVKVAEDETDLVRHFAQQFRRWVAIDDIVMPPFFVVVDYHNDRGKSSLEQAPSISGREAPDPILDDS